MKRDFTQAVSFSHQLLTEHLKGAEGRKVLIDATAGNGYDTLFLTKLVGEKGKVYAFDIQQIALETTRNRLQSNRRVMQVELINAGHELLTDYIKEPVDGIVFNLGYLPGGNKEIKTRAATTVKAIKKGISLLKDGGLIVIVVYTGHTGGQEELMVIIDYLQGLDDTVYNVLHYHFLNQDKTPPQLLAVKKR